MTRDRAGEIATATFCRKRYLNGLDGKLYWSDCRDTDPQDDPDGGPFYETPESALGTVLAAAGHLVRPETGEIMLVQI